MLRWLIGKAPPIVPDSQDIPGEGTQENVEK
jgi:hypothetical protein